MVEIKYEKLMEDKSIKLDELPKNAVTGIKSIKQWQMMVNLHKKTGKVTRQDIWDKMEAVDEWVCKEINNYTEGKKPTGTVAPVKGPTPEEIETEKAKAAAIEAEKNNKKPDEVVVVNNEDKRGDDVDKELKVLLSTGKSSLTLQELKDTAPNAYAVVFEAYEPDGQNGISTSHYQLLETQKETFTLTKK